MKHRKKNNSTRVILKKIFILGRINQKIKKIIIYHTLVLYKYYIIMQ